MAAQLTPSAGRRQARASACLKPAGTRRGSAQPHTPWLIVAGGGCRTRAAGVPGPGHPAGRAAARAAVSGAQPGHDGGSGRHCRHPVPGEGAGVEGAGRHYERAVSEAKQRTRAWAMGLALLEGEVEQQKASVYSSGPQSRMHCTAKTRQLGLLFQLHVLVLM
jgi:hypothetical protein